MPAALSLRGCLHWQLQGVCQQIADKCAKQRGPNAVGPPQKVDYGNKSFGEIEAENDAFFGLGDGEELEELPPPRRSTVAASTPAAAPAPVPTPAPTPAPAPQSQSVDLDGRSLSAPSRAQVPNLSSQMNCDPFVQNRAHVLVYAQQNSQNLAPPVVADPDGRKFSEYLPPRKDKVIGKKATPGSVRGLLHAKLASCLLPFILLAYTPHFFSSPREQRASSQKTNGPRLTSKSSERPPPTPP